MLKFMAKGVVFMKVLSIGNSFSEDAQAYLHKLALECGIEIDSVNLFIGGCSLVTHYNNIMENKVAYMVEENGVRTEKWASVSSALDNEIYDIITLQQASSSSGMPQTYIPYLVEIYNFVKEKQPSAKIYFHQTWAYEIDSEHSGFANYNHSQTEMFRRIVDASQMASKLISAPIIPSGSVIQSIRDTVEGFDYKNGGLSLCRDGFHLSLDYGRFSAAATWIKCLTGKNIVIDGFEDFDKNLINKILKVVNEFEY